MKNVFLMAAAFLMFLLACTKKVDVPSLEEQKQGQWQIKSYLEEKYHFPTNTLTRNKVECRPGSYMDFSATKVLVYFDSTGVQQWTSAPFDYNTFLIEGKKWDAVTIDEKNFHISLAQRDSTPKQREVVFYELMRP